MTRLRQYLLVFLLAGTIPAPASAENSVPGSLFSHSMSPRLYFTEVSSILVKSS